MSLKCCALRLQPEEKAAQWMRRMAADMRRAALEQLQAAQVGGRLGLTTCNALVLRSIGSLTCLLFQLASELQRN